MRKVYSNVKGEKKVYRFRVYNYVFINIWREYQKEMILDLENFLNCVIN